MRAILDKSKYAKLLVHILPEAIESAQAHKKAITTVEKLLAKDMISTEDKKLAKLLTALIVAYEKEHFPNAGDASPLAALQYLMKNKNHTAKDLWGIIGDKGTVSKILNGHRSISKFQAKQLAKFYNVSSALFI